MLETVADGRVPTRDAVAPLALAVLERVQTVFGLATALLAADDADRAVALQRLVDELDAPPEVEGGDGEEVDRS